MTTEHARRSVEWSLAFLLLTDTKKALQRCLSSGSGSAMQSLRKVAQEICADSCILMVNVHDGLVEVLEQLFARDEPIVHDEFDLEGCCPLARRNPALYVPQPTSCEQTALGRFELDFEGRGDPGDGAQLDELLDVGTFNEHESQVMRVRRDPSVLVVHGDQSVSELAVVFGLVASPSPIEVFLL
jgi:hypothetical protein